MSKIVKDHEFLKQVSTKVDSVAEAKSIIEKLESELRKYDNGYGLSAIQIGIPKQISVIKYGKYDKEFIHLINPNMLERGEEFTFYGEGCLSFPGVYVETQRLKDFLISNDVIDGDGFREEKLSFCHPGDGEENSLESIAVEHEMDHILGKTILEYGKPLTPVAPIVRTNPKIPRNAPCPCGSGKKYKKCCLK